MNTRIVLVFGALLAAAAASVAQEPFKNLVGDYKVAEVKSTAPLQVPFILWGGDVATFMANGGMQTKPDSTFGKMGLNLSLKPGDDFPAQVKDYLEGKSPFLRGTLSMICQASEVIGADEKTKPVVFLQMTWSNGDYLVTREDVKTLNDLRGKKIAIQKGGPHVGWLHDCLTAAGLKWSDVNVVWADAISGPKSPPELFSTDDKIDACFAITPDMEALTGGVGKTGTGAGGTVKGARVLVSASEMSSIADVYACRKDFFDKNKDLVEKFAAGYLKACEDLRAIKPTKDNKGDAAAYRAVCKLAVDVYSKDKGTQEAVSNEAVADGLISDAEFVQLPGNVYFFKAPGWSVGFKAKEKDGLDAAEAIKSISKRTEFGDAGWDYTKVKNVGGLKDAVPTDLTKLPEVKIDAEKLKKLIGERSTSGGLVSRVIYFGGDQDEFDEKEYGKDFEKAVKDAATFKNAIIVVRGHTDLAYLLQQFAAAAVEKGYLTKKEAGGKAQYFLKDGKELKLEDTAAVLKAIGEWDFSGASANPQRTLRDLNKLSGDRAATVQKSVLAFAKKFNLPVDMGRLQSVGVGPAEPVDPNPADKTAGAKNRRVEFRVVRLPTEATDGP